MSTENTEEKHPVDRAKALGHKLVDDPPANMLSNMNRHTCTECGRAVLWNGRTAYGSALDSECKAFG